VENDGKSAEFAGKTVEEAIEKGLESLGLTRDQVYVEVLQAGSRGFLGLGSEEAYVRLVPKPRFRRLWTKRWLRKPLWPRKRRLRRPRPR